MINKYLVDNNKKEEFQAEWNITVKRLSEMAEAMRIRYKEIRENNIDTKELE